MLANAAVVAEKPAESSIPAHLGLRVKQGSVNKRLYVGKRCFAYHCYNRPSLLAKSHSA